MTSTNGGFVSKGLRRTNVGSYVDPKDPGEILYRNSPRRRSVTDEEAEILAQLAKGKVVLEFGTGLAVSTRALASTALQVVTVDPDPWVKDPGLPNVRFHRAPPMGPRVPGFFDLAFIDGHHATAAVVKDITYCLEMKIPCLVLHDTYLQGVRAAIKQCALREQKVYKTQCHLAVYSKGEG